VSTAGLESLLALLAHAGSERDAARAALRLAEEAAARHRTQAEQLQAYRGEYRQRWTERFAQAGTPALLHCHHGFGQRLDQAIDQQGRQVDHGARQVAQALALLQRREQRLAAVRKLVERRLAEQGRSAARREQKQTDEAAQRAAWLARSSTDAH
jgi:flagellar FliJ protein